MEGVRGSMSENKPESEPYEQFNALVEWLADTREMKAVGTYKARKTDANRFAAWCDEEGITPQEATGRDVHKHIRSLLDLYAENTVKGAFDSLSQFYGWLSSPKASNGIMREDDPTEELERREYKPRDDADNDPDADPADDEQEILYATPEDVETLVEHVHPPGLKHELMIRLMYQTGVRQSELVRIQVEKIDTQSRDIRVRSPKTGDWRMVHYKPSLDFLLRQWLESERDMVNTAPDSPYLFPGPRTKRHRPRHVNRLVTEAAEKAGIQKVVSTDANGRERHYYTSHSLRHGFAVRAMQNGMNIIAVRDLLGHMDISTTQIYLRFADDDTKKEYEKW